MKKSYGKVKNTTIKKVSYTNSYIYNNYIVVDTGLPIELVTKKDIEILLKQKARQVKILWLRLNCLRSFRHILNKMPGYGYKGELLPGIYLRRVYENKK